MTPEGEKVLCIPTESEFPNWQGISRAFTLGYIERLVHENGRFLERGGVEEDPSVKQIIPYVIFRHKDKYFLMQRLPNHKDARLASKFSLGIGGHVNPEDLERESIIDMAMREFSEEVNYSGSLEFSYLGLLYDGSDAVGQVHLGVVLIADGDSDQILVRNEHKQGKMLSFSEIGQYYENLEGWSRMVFDCLNSDETQNIGATG